MPNLLTLLALEGGHWVTLEDSEGEPRHVFIGGSLPEPGAHDKIKSEKFDRDSLREALKDWVGGDSEDIRPASARLIKSRNIHVSQGYNHNPDSSYMSVRDEAAGLLLTLRKSPKAPTTLYRGMDLSAYKRNQILAQAKKGTLSFALSSFSRKESVAHRFLAGEELDEQDRNLLIEVVPGAKAINVNRYSLHMGFAGEREFITSGRFRVQRVYERSVRLSGYKVSVPVIRLKQIGVY